MTDALTSDAAPPADPTPGDPRAEKVAAAVATWQRSLVDLGGRNTLLWYRDLPKGTLDLTTAHPGGVSMLLAGRRTRLSDLFREPAAFDEARRRARVIRAKALELREERGIAAGFIAVGMATWTVPRAPRPPAAPVLLRACVLRPTAAGQEDFEVALGPDIELNPVLVEYLRSEQGIELDADAIADRSIAGTAFDPYPVYAALEAECARVRDFAIAPRVVLGTFSYAKLPMVADLALQGETLANHDVVAALAGDEDALRTVRMRLPDPVPNPDPSHEHLVLDADSSQQAAIDAVRAGAHLVIKGPPGTGKSQTIANLIASLAAEGKSTLFVAEKRAAIDAVLQRLDHLGLGDLVLDAYDGLTNKRAVARQFLTTLDHALDEVDEGDASAAAVVEERRDRLVEHLTALHATREPWGVSAFDAQEAMAELAARPVAPTSRVRLRSSVVRGISRTRAVELGRRLRDAVGLGAWTPDHDDAWFGARILTMEEATRAHDITSRLSSTELDDLGRTLNEILAESQVPKATSLEDWRRAFTTMERVRDTLEVFRPEVFDSPLTEHIAATATPAWRREREVEMGPFARWRIRRQARRLLRPGRPPASLHDELVAASEQRTHWFSLVGGGGRPEISPRLDEGLALLAGIVEEVEWLSDRLAGTSRGGDLMGLPMDELQERLAGLAARPDRLAVLPQVTATLDDLREVGLGEVIDDLAARGVPTDEVVAEVEHVWWGSVAQDITLRDPRYGAHDGEGMRRAVEEYTAADRDHLRATVGRVKAAVARNIREIVADDPAQESLVRAEAGKARRHTPLRDLLPRAAGALTAIKPCWAMSPLVVASTLPPGRHFDVVVFDEASQVQPAQAISAISRARQVVVAGDERQLPPTNFFTVVSDDEDVPDASLTAGFESILDVLAAALPARRLTWHYRSRDERLIAFANHAVYDGALVTFPGTATESRVSFEPVDGTTSLRPGDESIESTEAEVARVVDLVLEHARTRPDESLGVIALGITHANRLEAAITDALRTAKDVADLFAEDRDERFFVKNLERVQGDERDAIILSVGYGKTPHGRVLHRFGPLNIEGGERRLNVAITRARTRMTVVSALRAEDLDPARLKARGALMLRDFLAYAESGGSLLPAGERGQTPRVAAGSGVSPDPLVRDLASRLRRTGLRVHEEYGTATHRIDLAVEDPYHRGRGLIAVETDGARYAAMPSARDRDRLRPEQLERLGWTHVRVWSTDLFRDPAKDAARIAAVVGDRTPVHGFRAPEGWREEDRDVHPAIGYGPHSGDDPPSGRMEGVSSENDTPADRNGSSGEASVPDAAASNGSGTGSGREVATGSANGHRRRPRRAFRKGTGTAPTEDADFGPTRDDTDAGWGERAAGGESASDRWLREQRPPHHE